MPNASAEQPQPGPSEQRRSAADGTPIVGILGGGQLGLMLAQAAATLGVRCRLFDSEPDACAGAAAELTSGSFDDADAVRRFAAPCTVVTCEFENVPAAALEAARSVVPTRPVPSAFAVAQDRARERAMLEACGIPTPAWAPADSLESAREAAARLGLPVVLKARRLGYDGKGQAVVHEPGELEWAWRRVAGDLPAWPIIVDELVPFRRELSIIAARAELGSGGDGRPLHREACCEAFYPLVENAHERGILVRTVAPAPGISAERQAEAEGYARRLMIELSYAGVLAIEFFELDDGAGGTRLVANEIAPRVHNTGHWTIEGAATSQFAQHLRGVLSPRLLGGDRVLGPTEPVGHARMLNCIGRMPELGELARRPGVHVHDYGKSPRAGRKVGHVTVVAHDAGAADELAASVAALLVNELA